MMKHPKDFTVGYTDTKFNVGVQRADKVVHSGGIIHINGLLSPEFIDEVNDWFDESSSIRVGINGKPSDHTTVGSDRISVFDTDSAFWLHFVLLSYVPNQYQGNSDLSGGHEWISYGINPLWRGIRYMPGDALVAHYDDTFIESDNERSLLSVVMYFTEGSTRFMTDPRQNHNYEDGPEWIGEVDLEVKCKPGDVLVFDHRLFHDGPKVTQEKRIIRTDMMFRKI